MQSIVSSSNLTSLETNNQDTQDDEKIDIINITATSGNISENLSKQLHIITPIDPVDKVQHELFLNDRYKYIKNDYKLNILNVVEWRMKDRMRTVSVALVACLNIGVDPPDIVKPQPCARLECWEDPLGMPPQKALDTIGNTLQAQYERWQPRARYKQSLDPTMEDVRKLCLSLRRAAKEERVLFHYNGHGVPRPTNNGEIWVFNKNYTQYIPLSLFDVQQWMGTPSIYVFDCSAAALIIDSFSQFESQFRDKRTGLVDQSHESILLVPCGPNELLPMNPEFPADLFTSCLTTPIKTALRWFASRSVLTHLPLDVIDKIPGRLNDRKTPLGEINWIFTAITDTIAWSVLPKDLFQKLFRQDLLVASLFRNFLLAERILKSVNCNPVSKPKLPSTHQHPMWKAWDLAAEFCMSELDKFNRAGCTPAAEAKWERSTFYNEQMTAFQVWIQFGTPLKPSPIQLPVVLQVLLSQVHRHRALFLLGQYLDKGSWAVNQALSVGIFPYVLRLLQSPAPELREVLILIWAKILALDKSCVFELLKDPKEEYPLYFLAHLSVGSNLPCLHQAMATFILSVICDGHVDGQKAVLAALPFTMIRFHLLAEDDLVRRWMCFLCATLWQNYEDAKIHSIREGIPEKLKLLLRDSVPEVRAAAVHCIAAFVSTYHIDVSTQMLHNPEEKAAPIPQVIIPCSPSLDVIATQLSLIRCCLKLALDANVLVRLEVQIALQAYISANRVEFSQIVSESLDHVEEFITSTLPSSSFNEEKEKEGSTANKDIAGRVKIWKIILLAKKDPQPIVAQVAYNTCRLIELMMKKASREVEPRHESSSNSGSGSGSASKLRTPSVDIAAKGVSPHFKQNQNQSLHFNRHKLPLESRQFGIDPTSFARPSVIQGLPNQPQESSFLPTSIPISHPYFPTQINSDTQLRSKQNESLSWKPNLSRYFSCSAAYFSTSILSPILDDALLTQSTPGAPWVEQQSKIWRFQRNFSVQEEARKIPAKFESTVKHNFDDQIAIFQTEFQETSCLFFHPYEPILFAADSRDKIGLWNYEDGNKISIFSNSNSSPARISSMSLVNDLHVSMLLTGTDDGIIRLWRNPHVEHCQELVTSFSALSNKTQKTNLVFDWQQNSSRLVCGGSSEAIRVWDMDREQCVSDILVTPPMAALALQTAIENRQVVQPPVTRLISPNLAPLTSTSIPSFPSSFTLQESVNGSNSRPPSLRSENSMLNSMSLNAIDKYYKATNPNVLSLCSSADGNLFISGCSDGTVRIFDIRCPQPLISALAEHRTSVIKVHLQRGAESGGLLVSGGSSGDVVHADLRNLSDSIVRIAAHSNSELNALAVHDYAPIIASGSHKQFIKVFNTEGDPLSMIRHHDGFLGQRIGPVSALAFHKHKLLLAAGALDSYISIYSGN